MKQSSITFGPRPIGKERLFLSFSGGRTSGMMTKLCLDHLSEQYEIVVGFANTGQENEATLEFVRNCDEVFGFKTVWLEGVVHHDERKGSTHRVVTFETASRKGEPFEAMIQKYGIPNQRFPHCTRELKLNVMQSYLKSIGWTDYITAIGVRPDEARRVDEKAVAQMRIVYPLIEFWYSDKQDVNDWWEDQPFNLQLLEHEGNCKWCWKKHFTKHARLLTERPEIYDFPARMESTYGHIGPEQGLPGELPRVFFREHTSTLNLAKKAFAVKPETARFKERPDENGGCSESCEMYPMLDLT